MNELKRMQTKIRLLFIFIMATAILFAGVATASAEEEMEEWSCGNLDFDMLASGPAGTPLSITGNDADPGNIIQFLWDGSPIGTTTADANGNFAIQFNVPADAAPGPHTVAFSGWNNQDVFTNCPGTFTVTGSSSPEVTPEQPGATSTETPVTQQVTGSTSSTATTTTGSLPSTGLPLLPVAGLALGGLGLAALGRRKI